MRINQTICMLCAGGMLSIGLFTGCVSDSKLVKKSEAELEEMDQRSCEAHEAFQRGDYDKAEKLLKELSAEPTVSQPLYLAELGAVQLAQNREMQARHSFLTSQMLLESFFDAESEEKATSMWSAELNKIYKGEPYERASLYLVLGLLFLNENDIDNALACFKSGLLADADVAEDYYSSDFTILQLLAARCHLLRGEEEEAFRLRRAAFESLLLENPDLPSQFIDQYDLLLALDFCRNQARRLRAQSANEEVDDDMREALRAEAETLEKTTLRQLAQERIAGITGEEKQPDPEELSALNAIVVLSDDGLTEWADEKREKDPFEYLRKDSCFSGFNEKYNTLLVLWNGRGPSFSRRGKYGQIRFIGEGRITADAVVIYQNNQYFQPLQGIGNLNYQATTRGLRKMDQLLQEQANTRLYTENSANICLGIGLGLLQSGNLYAGVIGGGFLVIGGGVHLVALCITPQADIRHWKNLPREFSLLPLNLPPGEHEFSMQAFMQATPVAVRTFKINVNSDNVLNVKQVVSGDFGAAILQQLAERGTVGLWLGRAALENPYRKNFSEEEIEKYRQTHLENSPPASTEVHPLESYAAACKKLREDFQAAMVKPSSEVKK